MKRKARSKPEKFANDFYAGEKALAEGSLEIRFQVYRGFSNGVRVYLQVGNKVAFESEDLVEIGQQANPELELSCLFGSPKKSKKTLVGRDEVKFAARFKAGFQEVLQKALLQHSATIAEQLHLEKNVEYLPELTVAQRNAENWNDIKRGKPKERSKDISKEEAQEIVLDAMRKILNLGNEITTYSVAQRVSKTLGIQKPSPRNPNARNLSNHLRSLGLSFRELKKEAESHAKSHE